MARYLKFVFLEACIQIHLSMLDTLFVANRYNLLSVSKLLRTTKLSLTFTTDCCFFQDQRTKNVAAVAPLVQGLYILDDHSFQVDTIQRHLSNFHSVNTILPIDSINKGSSICNSAVDFSVLHTRLGHASIKKMKHIFHISFTKADCHICSIAKMHRLPFLHSTSHSSEPFQLIQQMPVFWFNDSILLWSIRTCELMSNPFF